MKLSRFNVTRFNFHSNGFNIQSFTLNNDFDVIEMINNKKKTNNNKKRILIYTYTFKYIEFLKKK